MINNYIRNDNLAPRTKIAASLTKNCVCVCKIGWGYSRICKMFDLAFDKINQLFRGHFKLFVSNSYKLNDCSSKRNCGWIMTIKISCNSSCRGGLL